jgi:hypothetical protein
MLASSSGKSSSMLWRGSVSPAGSVALTAAREKSCTRRGSGADTDRAGQLWLAEVHIILWLAETAGRDHSDKV